MVVAWEAPPNITFPEAVKLPVVVKLPDTVIPVPFGKAFWDIIEPVNFVPPWLNTPIWKSLAAGLKTLPPSPIKLAISCKVKFLVMFFCFPPTLTAEVPMSVSSGFNVVCSG